MPRRPAKREALEPEAEPDGNDLRISVEIAQKHDTLMPLLLAMARSFEELAKKKPDGALNRRKVEIVNRLLRDVLSILQTEPTAAYMDMLDEDVFPQNSDVVLILGQFVVAMEGFAKKHQRRTSALFPDMPGDSISWITK